MTTSAAMTNARVSQHDARRSLEHVQGMTVDRALTVLRFSPGHTCPPLERVLASALAQVRAQAPQTAASELVVIAGQVGDGDVITRLRRHAHGDAYWLTTQTTSIEVEIAPAGSESDLRQNENGDH